MLVEMLGADSSRRDKALFALRSLLGKDGSQAAVGLLALLGVKQGGRSRHQGSQHERALAGIRSLFRGLPTLEDPLLEGFDVGVDAAEFLGDAYALRAARHAGVAGYAVVCLPDAVDGLVVRGQVGPLQFPEVLLVRTLGDHPFILRNFDDEDFLQWDDINEKIAAYSMAADKASSVENELKSMNRDVYEYQFYIRRADLEIMRRFVQALACLILFFIGAPLGSFVRKGGLGTAAIIAVLFFVLYWVVDLTGTKLAKDGAVSPANGALIPLYVLVPIGTFLLWKAAHDSAFNTDQLKSTWRKIKSRITGFFKKTRIVYMGTPEFAVAPLDALIAHGYKIAGVVTVADKPSGRGLKGH